MISCSRSIHEDVNCFGRGMASCSITSQPETQCLAVNCSRTTHGTGGIQVYLPAPGLPAQKRHNPSACAPHTDIWYLTYRPKYSLGVVHPSHLHASNSVGYHTLPMEKLSATEQQATHHLVFASTRIRAAELLHRHDKLEGQTRLPHQSGKAEFFLDEFIQGHKGINEDMP